MCVNVRFKVPTATGMKMATVIGVAPCSLVDTDRSFRGAYCLHYLTLMMEVVNSSETSLCTYQTTKFNIPEHSLFQVCEHSFSKTLWMFNKIQVRDS
jgi:hypothetical protein